MMKVKLILVALVASLLFHVGCGSNKRDTGKESTIVIAVEGDAGSFNPLFEEEITGGEINDLLFPGLVSSTFDAARGVLEYTPSIAKEWNYENDNRSIVFHLRTDLTWSDGEPVRARDVQYTYELYGDPEIGSVRQWSTETLRRTDNTLDITKSVEVLNDSVVVFHFERVYPGQLFDAGLPILPAHVFANISHGELRTHSINKSPISSGPFLLKHWIPMQEVVLGSNSESKNPFPAKVQDLIFRILPDYRSRIAQLKSGEVDVVTDLRMEDIPELSSNPMIDVRTIPGRGYDFLGWNNIDPKSFEKSGGKAIQPHKLFGNKKVRRALTMAINREEITNAFLGQYGQQAMGGVSPLFKWAMNDTLHPLPFDKNAAQQLLAQEGWKDSDGDGILDRHGVKFQFTLMVPGGNQLRSVIATVVQKQLRDIMIQMEIEQVERGTFWAGVSERKYDAFFAGMSVPLQMQLDELWGSDLQKNRLNFVGYQNKRVDEILYASRNLKNDLEGRDLWKEFQVIMQEDQPCTFLFWVDQLVGINKRVKNAEIGISGTTHGAWNWKIIE